MHKVLESVLKTTSVSDLRHDYHLDYIISEKKRNSKWINEKKIAVIAHVNYSALINYCFKYISNIPNYIDIYITTKGTENIQVISKKIEKLGRNNIKIVVPQDRGREISALLVACKDYLLNYDYLCFVHDKKKNKGEAYITVGQSFCDLLWENTLKSQFYIENVIDTLEKEENLGLLSPPAPYLSDFFTIGFYPWCDSFMQTKLLKERLKLNCILDEKKQPFILGTTFWCKVDALRPLFEAGLTYDDFANEPMPEDDTISHGIERIFPYVAQSQGYYSGIMMTEEYASLYKSNYKFMLKKIAQNIVVNSLNADSCSFTQSIQSDNRLEKFVQNNEEIYIYGAGQIGQRCLKRIKAQFPNKECMFIISKNKCTESIAGCKVFEINELNDISKLSIIVAMKFDYLLNVMPILKRKNARNIIIFKENYI